MWGFEAPGYGPINGPPAAYPYIVMRGVNVLNCRVQVVFDDLVSTG
jgi:hypothetical protein